MSASSILANVATARVEAAFVQSAVTRLPASYANAVAAIAECARIDECKEWADKAAALASYARQADDTTLHDYATRIRARAVRRAGELLAEFQVPAGVGRPENNGAGGGPISQRAAAEEAGLSKRQEKTYARVAAIAADEFEALVESEHPPTVTQLAEIGKASRPKAEAPPGFVDATQVIGAVAQFHNDFVRRYEPGFIASGTYRYEVPKIREHVASVRSWLLLYDELLSDLAARDPWPAVEQERA